MRLEQRGDTLLIAELPLEQMAFLSMALPLDEEVAHILTALLQGKRVRLCAEGLEYKRYKKTASLGVYQKFMAMERGLREMGIGVVRQSS